MKSLPILLIGAGLAVASLLRSPAPDPSEEFARQFVACADVSGPAACERYLDEWSKRPDARSEMIAQFAKDKAFALHLLAFGDDQIVTGSIKK